MSVCVCSLEPGTPPPTQYYNAVKNEGGGEPGIS